MSQLTTYTSIMTKEQLAASLDGCQYREEMDGGFAKMAKDAGLIIIYGASDDLMEFEGAVYDEIGAWDGATAMFFKNKGRWDVCPADREVVRDIADDDTMMNALAVLRSEDKNRVTAEWCPKDFEGSWRITTDLPHATFDVMEEDKLYCRGLVIDTRDLL